MLGTVHYLFGVYTAYIDVSSGKIFLLPLHVNHFITQKDLVNTVTKMCYIVHTRANFIFLHIHTMYYIIV